MDVFGVEIILILRAQRYYFLEEKTLHKLNIFLCRARY